MQPDYEPLRYAAAEGQAPADGWAKRKQDPAGYRPMFYPPPGGKDKQQPQRFRDAHTKPTTFAKKAPAPPPRPSSYVGAGDATAAERAVPRDGRGKPIASHMHSMDELEAAFTRLAGSGPNTGLWSRGGLAQRRLQLEAAAEMVRRDLDAAAAAGNAGSSSPAALTAALQRVEEEHARLRAANRRLETRLAEQTKELRRQGALLKAGVPASTPRDDHLQAAAKAATARRKVLQSAQTPRQTKTSESRRRRAEALENAARRLSARAHGSSRAADAVAEAVAELITDASEPVAEAEAAEERARAALDDAETARDAAAIAGAARESETETNAAQPAVVPEVPPARTPAKRRTWNERWNAPAGGAEARAAKAALALAARARLRDSSAAAPAPAPAPRKRQVASAGSSRSLGAAGASIKVSAAHAVERRRFAEGIAVFEEEIRELAREEQRLRKHILQSVSSSTSSALALALPGSGIPGGQSSVRAPSSLALVDLEMPTPPASACVSRDLARRVTLHRDARLRRRAALEGGAPGGPGASNVVHAVSELLLSDLLASAASELARHLDAVGDALVAAEASA